MKKLFLLSIAILGFIFAASAQEISKNALGLRLGDSDGFGAEISYQHALGENNRLELDLGWRDGNNYDGFKIAGLYQWVMLLDGNFNWYVGAGGGLGSFSVNVPGGSDITDTFVFAAGDIGIEYNFDIPLLLSLDFRPEIGFGDDAYNNNDLDFDIALGIRYQF
ncbi:porin family protein [Sabulilitoribacter arenilitoris]|uniref:Porin family protein n=1 Tax=Wocania arenilitoris TaxID=2044858 RepID=A0AAE3ERJ1_9FLAO|nr:porin family protein [Wocania arenilitoris]MCF7569472.1 porin family protein [Wocania arenilitoris]